jgi:hypothetical protein
LAPRFPFISALFLWVREGVEKGRKRKREGEREGRKRGKGWVITKRKKV